MKPDPRERDEEYVRLILQAVERYALRHPPGELDMGRLVGLAATSLGDFSGRVLRTPLQIERLADMMGQLFARAAISRLLERVDRPEGEGPPG